jgi:nucleoside-diphosphate-sugar epimerase
MKILITGGAGFIGSHLSERLLKEGHSVVIVDDLNDFYSPARKRANLRAIADIADVPFYEAATRTGCAGSLRPTAPTPSSTWRRAPGYGRRWISRCCTSV